MSSLAEYGSVPIRFTVTSVLDVQPIENGLGGWRLTERQLDVPYDKDYDQPEPPTRWARHGDLANWAMLAAYAEEGEDRVGGAVVAHRTPGVYVLEGHVRCGSAIAIQDFEAPTSRRETLGDRRSRESRADDERMAFRPLDAGRRRMPYRPTRRKAPR